MRTKTLLIAVAALATGILASKADNVYSANIVGYANTSVGAGYQIYVNPLSVGVSNGANEIFSSLPDGSSILTWNGAGYDVFYYDSSLGISPNNWYLADGFTPGPIPTLQPGKGFFLSPGNSFTNTFVGTVLPGAGQTNSTALSAGYSLIGSALPVAGSVTNASFNLPLVDGMTVLKWNGAGYDTYYYDSTLGISADGWYLSDGFTPGPVPAISVGQGFFYSPGQPVTWTQALNP